MPSTLKLTPELADALADAVRTGVPIETAAQAAGLGPRTIYNWLAIAQNGHRNDGVGVTDETLRLLVPFGEQIAAAQAQFEAARIQSIARAADQVNPKTGITEWRAGAWLLNNHPRYRQRYRQEHVSKVEQTGTVHHEHTLTTAADDASLEQWASLALPAATTTPEEG